MPNVLTEPLYGLVSGSVSAIDGRPFGVQGGMTSAFLGTFYDWLHKQSNRILTASTALMSGGSAGAVAISTSGMGSLSAMSGIFGTLQNVPFFVTGEALSGSPASDASPGYSTTSMTIRKVLVCLTISSLPVASSIATASVTVQFVYGSAFAVSYANACSVGGASAWFNQVPLPKPSAMQVPVGWLNIFNSFAASAGLAAGQMICDLRATQGIDLSLLQGTVQQP